MILIDKPTGTDRVLFHAETEVAPCGALIIREIVDNPGFLPKKELRMMYAPGQWWRIIVKDEEK